jgi:hypothetical protein
MMVRSRLALACGAAVFIAIAAGCGSNDEQSPSTPTTTTTPSTTTTTTTTPPPATTTPSAAPTEKNLDPTGGNLFSPQVIAPPAPTEPPGVHRGKH